MAPNSDGGQVLCCLDAATAPTAGTAGGGTEGAVGLWASGSGGASGESVPHFLSSLMYFSGLRWVHSKRREAENAKILAIFYGLFNG